MRHGTKQRSAGPAPRDSALDCLSLVARFHGLIADPAELDTRLAPAPVPRDFAQLYQAAKLVGLKSRRAQKQYAQLASTPLPAIAITTDGEYVVVARANAQQVLVLDPLQHGPREMAAREFEAGWSGHIVLLTRRTSCASQDQRFGFP